MKRLIARCIREESGTEVIEYALMVGLIVVGALVVIGAFGVKLVGRWTSIYDRL